MTARVTIDQAIQKARMTVHMPATCIMFAAWGQALILVPSGQLPQVFLFMSMAVAVSGWPLAWLYRAWMTPRWKLWAYAGAGNVQQMKDAAIVAKVIGPDGGFSEKSEICSKEMRAQILRLEGRA
ncbi:hypothetical protein ABI_13940 [Asticcacaulis biprosthecium C19]|uniref:Uncharacterized protein n=1 Tax=Asticcacaulis biprosthecium C19 TaxID=715226 RepID=F4QIG6_9CAUL|nr:hypothetical protein [Asticcacaulis biprosthecium]EGF92955.1 hypothetical protein ABI_13940 [Asticcacaulis biprosthecium C19]